MRFAWLAFAILFLSFVPHPYYLSVTDVTYNAKAQGLELSVKLFTNDLEEALKKTANKPVDVLNPADRKATEQIIFDYVSKRLLLRADNKPVAYHMIGYEKEEEAVWIYLESGKTARPRKLDIEDKLLYDYQPQQINIVHAEVNGVKQSGKVTNPEDKLSFNF